VLEKVKKKRPEQSPTLPIGREPNFKIR